jgi:membrane protein
MGTNVALARSRALIGRAGELFPVRVVRKFAADDGGNLAILVAWNALTSIFPIALALVAVVGAVLGQAGVSADAITRIVVHLFPSDPGSQQAALNAIESVRQRTGVFAVLALLGFLWTASGLFGAMERAFAAVFETDGRPVIRQKLMSLAMMGLFVILTLVAVGTSALVPLLNQIPGLPLSVTVRNLGFVIQAAIGVVSGFVLFFVIYLVVPNQRLGLRVWTGALFAGIAFELLTQLFPIYLHFNHALSQYGGNLALLFILLAFFYFLGVITVLGAEVISALDHRLGVAQVGREASRAPDRPPSGVKRAALAGLAFAIGVLAGRRRR